MTDRRTGTRDEWFEARLQLVKSENERFGTTTSSVVAAAVTG